MLDDEVKQSTPGGPHFGAEPVPEGLSPRVQDGTRKDVEIVRVDVLEVDMPLAKVDEDWRHDRIELVQVLNGHLHRFHEA